MGSIGHWIIRKVPRVLTSIRCFKEEVTCPLLLWFRTSICLFPFRRLGFEVPRPSFSVGANGKQVLSLENVARKKKFQEFPLSIATEDRHQSRSYKTDLKALIWIKCRIETTYEMSGQCVISSVLSHHTKNWKQRILKPLDRPCYSSQLSDRLVLQLRFI